SMDLTARASPRKARSIARYEKFAFRPLGLGSTNTRAPSNDSRWRPHVTRVDARAPNTARYNVTPTNATIAGFQRLTRHRSVRWPITYSLDRSVSMPGVARGIRFVMP